MKCDELKDYDYDPDFPFQSRGRFYVADEVDAAIAELKAKLYEAEEARIEAGADAADYYQENRNLKRALWLARAERAKMEIHRDYPYEWTEAGIKCWEKCEQLCMAKAKEYK